MTAPSLTAGQQWHVAFTQPNCEGRAAAHLLNQDFPVYLPRFMKRRHIGRREVKGPSPLFPRYLFVAVDVAHQRWRAINGTVGVLWLLCHGGRPSAIDTSVVEAISGREDESGLVKLAPMKSFRPGEAIRVTGGVFADQLGLCEGMADENRVHILLDLLGRKVRVLIEADALMSTA
jgi:transcriptional antiterminator RfaH